MSMYLEEIFELYLKWSLAITWTSGKRYYVLNNIITKIGLSKGLNSKRTNKTEKHRMPSSTLRSLSEFYMYIWGNF